MFGFFLFITGPAMSGMITADLNEQPAIWCFFSICQITLMFCAVLAIQAGGGNKEEKAATEKGAAGKIA